MKSLSRKSKIKGSATLVVIIASVVFMLYAQSTRADAKHMTNMHEKYKESIFTQILNFTGECFLWMQSTR